MAEIDLEIGGRRYAVACRDGDEARFARLAAIIDAKMREAAGAMGGLNEVRQFLFASLLLADELEERRRGADPVTNAPPLSAADDALIETIERIAARLEALADGGVERERATS